MLGAIFHYGLYAVPAYDSVKSAKRRSTANGSEWYLKRLTETGTFRPTSGYKDTQEYHKLHYPNKEYSDFKELFLCENLNIDSWMETVSKIGCKYVILTAKHHDGYCLFETKTTEFNSVDSGPKKDILLEFKKSAKKYNMMFGIYYSWSEFNKSITIKYFNETIVPQIEELKKYDPDIFWFDGSWELKTKYAKEGVTKICKELKIKNPKILINDRIGSCKDEFKDQDYLGESSFRVYSDRYIPTETPKVPWEHINTIGFSWGRNIQQEEKDYKTGEKLYELYKKVNDMKGNFLINLGPNADGTLDEMEVNSLEKFGEIMMNKK
jgi:alpha-L-fucosidase